MGNDRAGYPYEYPFEYYDCILARSGSATDYWDWEADNPSGSKCLYGHPVTYAGNQDWFYNPSGKYTLKL